MNTRPLSRLDPGGARAGGYHGAPPLATGDTGRERRLAAIRHPALNVVGFSVFVA
ncbi:MAG TPA: hypothetical protein VJ045_08325 [Hyphomicrobiaceae bacterium]|nr:hypothetical protein [Hyphomicrobiaceae bacterium]